MEKKSEKEYEIVAQYTEGNYSYTVRQPTKKSTEEDLIPFKIALGKLLKS